MTALSATDHLARNRQFNLDLFNGPFRGHAIWVDPIWPQTELGDFACSRRPVREWVDHYVKVYETWLAHSMAIDDDAVPYAKLATNTGVFAAAFGCKLHVFKDMHTNACALPVVNTAAEADALPQPDWENVPTLARHMELALLLADRLGPDVPIGPPDVQSPFDIASLVWNKEELLIACIEDPDAVHRLVEKCYRLLEDFLVAFKTQVPNASLVHCPSAWVPADWGVWLSEDEAGAISRDTFTEMCLPTLERLSDRFGGMFMHCCAAADHQYENFAKVPNLRGLNRVFQQKTGPKPAIDRFSGQCVFMQAWLTEPEVQPFLDIAHDNTRYLFNMLNDVTTEEAKGLVERLKIACGRT